MSIQLHNSVPGSAWDHTIARLCLACLAGRASTHGARRRSLRLVPSQAGAWDGVWRLQPGMKLNFQLGPRLCLGPHYREALPRLPRRSSLDSRGSEAEPPVRSVPGWSLGQSLEASAWDETKLPTRSQALPGTTLSRGSASLASQVEPPLTGHGGGASGSFRPRLEPGTESGGFSLG